jgi:hypothetical protein
MFLSFIRIKIHTLLEDDETLLNKKITLNFSSIKMLNDL